MLLLKIKDPRVVNVTITNVSMKGDLKHARVYYSCRDEQIKEAEAGFASVKGYIRSHLAKELGMRYVPKLDFKRDLAMVKQEEMERLLREIEDENESIS